ncbi:MAG TPA: DUF192 domain-containing protein [Acidimicrobiia bacterium]|nr:DUF192 domain-containing protein [Acidimicrobiia bacterium]
MSRAAAALLGAALALGLFGAPAAGASAPPVSAALRAAMPATQPFPDLTQTTIRLGGRPLLVVVAQTEAEREAGLRQRATLGPYRGMLFVFQGDSSVGFTMSTVPVALDIGFYGANGRTLDRLRMTPCPHPESDCPVYEASHSFRYAVETLAGRLPRGSLTG